MGAKSLEKRIDLEVMIRYLLGRIDSNLHPAKMEIADLEGAYAKIEEAWVLVSKGGAVKG